MDIERMTELWADFVFEDRLSPEVRRPIAESWQKCKAAGVNPAGGEGRQIDERVLASAQEENRLFLEIARPIIERVHETIRSSRFMFVLTDSAGYLLDRLGDPDMISRSDDMRFTPGAIWSNLEVGTNAISVALDYDMPIQMAGPEHYCISHHAWTCSAAPIHGPNGEIIGCINLSGDVRDVAVHTLGMVQAAAYGIEGQIRQVYDSRMMQAAMENSPDSFLLLNQDDEPVWMNSAARSLFETDTEGLRLLGIHNVLSGIDWDYLDRKSGTRIISDNAALHVNGTTKYCSLVASLIDEYGTRSMSLSLRQQSHLIDTVNRFSGNQAVHTFRDYYTRDEGMKKKLALAATFARYEGNILIQGESGCGKEILAQAIHNAGKNASGPFVAVNCASIPRGMFEMELFGYEPGAFPNRVVEGKPGRFELAQNGTLFLDEVSTMPLEMQSKLLRAVETHCVQRLGSTQEIQLNIRIIAATNQDLNRMAERGEFRKDMYYRLSTLKLEIPPLRERPLDIELCAERFLHSLNEEFDATAPKRMSEEFLEGLQEYDWPGNVRQLQNSLARAYFNSTGTVLSAEDLAVAFEQAGPAEVPVKPKSDSGGGAIVAALTICGGDVDAAADRLGISRATLYRKMKKFGISPKQMKQP